MNYFGWEPYVPVAIRRAKAKGDLDKLRKKTGLVAQPVEISGRKIAVSFWGKGWCDHIESFSDYENRLPRGRTYVRNGSVCHLEIKPGRIEAMVSGSHLYNVVISVVPLAKTKWDAVKSSCSGRIGSLIDLLRGKIASGVMEVVCHQKTGLYPSPGEITFNCNCPDSAYMCKHVAAVLYGVGARLDEAPEKLFRLRGVNHEELVDLSAAVGNAATAKGSRRRIAATGLVDIFGIELAKTGAAVRNAADDEAARVSRKRVNPAARPNPGDAPGRATKTTKTAGPAKGVAKEVSSASLPEALPFPKRLTGKMILSWRGSLGETQVQFALRIGVSAACISQWEKKLRQSLQVRERALTALQKAWDDTQQKKPS